MVDGFYSFLGFPRLVNGAVVVKAIAKGAHESFFGYYSGTTPTLGADGKYQVPPDRVPFNKPVSEDEIDLESGFLMMPLAVPVAPSEKITPQPEKKPRDERKPNELSPAKTVEFSLSADRNQLYSAWNDLSDLAGNVNVTVRADSAEGFDKNKLHNGVLEPLRESDLIEK